MTLEWPRLMCLGMLLHYNLNLTFSAPPCIPDRHQADVFKGLAPLKSQPAKSRRLAQEFDITFTNPNSLPSYLYDDHFHSHDEFLFPHELFVGDMFESDGWKEQALSEPWEEGPGIIVSPSGERGISMIGDDDNGYDEPVEGAASQDENSDFILGKNSRAKSTGEVDYPLIQAPKKSQRVLTENWHQLADLGRRDISKIYRIALRKIKIQDIKDEAITEKYKKRIKGKLDKMARHTFGSEILKNLPIKIGKIKQFAGSNMYNVQIRPMKKGSSTVTRRNPHKIFNIIDVVSYYHNLAMLGGLDQVMFGMEGSAHQYLIRWIFRILFRGNSDSWPIIGQIKVAYPLQAPEKFFQSKPQRFLLKLLTEDKLLGKINGFKVAVQLMGHWYEDFASQVSRENVNFSISTPLFPSRTSFDMEFYEREIVKAVKKVVGEQVFHK
ncbi:hypothetical protein PtB15_9B568 [Puccinia triticina]|nr:hypothetical protein PtB15_9B568 [Puccinia triticina]